MNLSAGDRDNEATLEKEAVRYMIRARYVLHERSQDLGYHLADRSLLPFYHTYDTLFENYRHLHLHEVEQLTSVYVKILNDGTRRKSVVYTTYNTFNKDHVTKLMKMIMDEKPYRFHVICWKPPKPGDIQPIEDFNRDGKVKYHHVRDIQGNFLRHIHAPIYELIPEDDELVIMHNLGISSKAHLAQIPTYDQQLQSLELDDYIGRIIRVVYQKRIEYRLIVNRGRKDKSEIRLL